MNRLSLSKLRLRAGVGLAVAVVAALYLASSGCVVGADTAATNAPPAAKETKTEKKPEKKTEKKAEKKKLSGADLYAIHCNRCHPERYATERSPAQWKTIMLHMRVRANLPANDAKAVLKYLQEDSGTP